jgi:hypothetical protein
MATKTKNIKESGRRDFTKNLYSSPPGFDEASCWVKLSATKSTPM